MYLEEQHDGKLAFTCTVGLMALQLSSMLNNAYFSPSNHVQVPQGIPGNYSIP